MIAQVDAALRTIVRSEVVTGADVEVVFDAPTKDWAARRNTPTVNLYLYDIREDLRRRERGWSERRSDGVVVSRSPAPRYFKLSYLVTAWTQRPEDEHLLLDSLLRSFLRYEALPEPLVVGPLAETGLSVPVTVGLPPPEDRAFADVWSALGGELKPSLDVVVITPIDTGIVYPAGPPVTDGAYVGLRDRVRESGDAPRRTHRPPPAARAPRDPVSVALGAAARAGAGLEPPAGGSPQDAPEGSLADSPAERTPTDAASPGRTPRRRGRGNGPQG